jgi:hypothetical protein
MKTAMQEFINELLFIESIKENQITKSNKAILITAVIKQALEKEKEQICNAYTDGLEGPYIGAEEYYDQTFNK